MTTPAVFLDGGLQLGILLGAHCIGKRVLPTGAGEIDVFNLGPAPKRAECFVVATKKREEGLVYDVFLRGEDGRPLAHIRDLEATAVPNEAPAKLKLRRKAGAR